MLFFLTFDGRQRREITFKSPHILPVAGVLTADPSVGVWCSEKQRVLRWQLSERSAVDRLSHHMIMFVPLAVILPQLLLPQRFTPPVNIHSGRLVHNLINPTRHPNFSHKTFKNNGKLCIWLFRIFAQWHRYNVSGPVTKTYNQYVINEWCVTSNL